MKRFSMSIVVLLSVGCGGGTQPAREEASQQAEAQVAQPDETQIAKSAGSQASQEEYKQDLSNLTKIGMAMKDLRTAQQAFPRVNGSGKEDQGNVGLGLSYLVHLLPFIGQEELYGRFKLNEPWDSEANAKLITEMPAVYQSGGTREPGKTCFRVFVETDPKFKGTHFTIFHDPDSQKGPIRLRDCVDGIPQTILVIRGGSSTAIEWTKPGFLQVGENPYWALGDDVPAGLPVLLANGDVRTLDLKKMPLAVFHGLLTAGGREILPRDWDQKYKYDPGNQPKREQVLENLSVIGKAMGDLQHVDHAFPRFNGSGKVNQGTIGPGLSYLVHLLPYIGERELYGRFKLDEPWDSEANSKLLLKMPAIYRSGGTKDPGKTCFRVFVETDLSKPFTAFKAIDWQSPMGKNQRVRSRDCLDGSSNTILVVQGGPSTAIEWTRPGFLEVGDDPLRSLGQDAPAALPVLFADGKAMKLQRSKLDAKAFRAMLTAQGRETIKSR